MRICTIIDRNCLAQARVLALSYAEHNHGAPCTALLVDDPQAGVDDADEPFEIVRPDQLGIDRFDGMAAMYDLTALATAVKPWLLGHILERDAEPLAYFDPEIRFYDEIDEIRRLATDEELVLTPHVSHDPLPRDGLEPSELDLLAAGTYDLGFIALAPGETARRLIAWWSEHLRFDCVIEQGADVFVDQRWFDLIGSVIPRFHILRDPGANVAYWNLHERTLRHEADRYTVNGQPLRFFHFSGFDPARPFALSERQTRVRLADEPVIAELCDDYAAALNAQGFARPRRARWTYGRLADGTMLTPMMRRLYADGERAGAFRFSPFTEVGTEEFIAWCQEPGEAGAEHGLTRLCLAIHRRRPDISSAFPDLDGEDGQRFRGWIHEYGAKEFGLGPQWLPPTPVDDRPSAGEIDASAGGGEPWGVNVAGFLRSELGVGEAARTVIAALDARGVPVMPIQGRSIPPSRQGHVFSFVDPAAAPFPINLICVNADELQPFLADAGPEFSNNRYTIGFWWWEVTTFPERSAGALELLDEVWVGSEHVEEALRPLSDVPVVRVRIPVTMPPMLPHSRAELGLPDGFLFFFMFDFHSVFERKNPLAVIEAFRTAFEPDAGASLVIKCINHQSDLDNYDRLRLATDSRPDIHLVDRYVSAEHKDAMVAACDCYVSLHRSEGFGLTPAEAMYLGKPVIATRYSGNLDFMTDANSYLVDYELRPVGEGNFPYPANGEWADPDISHAARLMRKVVDDPLDAERRGRQGAADLRRTHSPDAAGEMMERRLTAIRNRPAASRPLRHSSPPARPTAGLLALQQLIERGPVARAEAKGGAPRRAAHGALARIMRPLTEYQRQINEGIIGELARHGRAMLRERRRTAAHTAALLAELRRREAALRAVHAELTAIKAQLGGSPRTSGSDGQAAAARDGESVSAGGPGR
jgi:glycosyltransferase involved in cell wall biosynthesis